MLKPFVACLYIHYTTIIINSLHLLTKHCFAGAVVPLVQLFHWCSCSTGAVATGKKTNNLAFLLSQKQQKQGEYSCKNPVTIVHNIWTSFFVSANSVPNIHVSPQTVTMSTINVLMFFFFMKISCRCHAFFVYMAHGFVQYCIILR